MKLLSSSLAVCALLIVAACGHNDGQGDATPVLDLSKNAEAVATAPIAVTDFTYAQLDGDTAAAFFKNAVIIDVMGDTAVLLEKDPMMTRIIMFDITTGKYLGNIDHRGQGPDEYRMILGAFVNDADGTVLIPNFDTPAVYKYSLAADTLVTTLTREPVMSMIEPIGGVASAINTAAMSPEGLSVIQYNGDYQLIDTLNVAGFTPGNFNILWANAGVNGVMMVADTLYTLTPGLLQPTAILSREELAITPEKDMEITMQAMEGEDEIELLKPYILVRDVQFTDGKMLLTTMHNGQKYSDLYDLANGSLLYRSTYNQLSTPNMIVVTGHDGKPIAIERLFAKNGKWYGIVNEDKAAELFGNTTTDSNCAIVTFSL